ncbi:protein FAM117A-like [Engraulis encrasicolus]|uniref:protein FAM117A-like n=1 Tax=Engraulis encrasicolus TaxID=184585 RepID=UPI002FD24146
MCSRGGVGVARGSSGLQPMKATVLFQLNNSNKAQTTLRDAKSASGSEKQLWSSLTGQTAQHSPSLDAIVGPYLHGHWPKDATHYKDKATQTPASWAEHQQGGPIGGLHKRSASWGSAAHKEVSRQRQQQPCAVVQGGSLDRRRIHALTQAGNSFSPPLPQSQPVPIPLSAVHTRLRHSEEKLDQELETIFKQHSTLLHANDFLVPNGRRGPVPPYSSGSIYSSSSPSSSASLSSSMSPGALHITFPSPPPVIFTQDTDGGGSGSGGDVPSAAPAPISCVGEGKAPLSSPAPPASPSPVLLSSSPLPNKSVCFQREPPEGCEKVPVCEEVLSSNVTRAPVVPSCPDLEKVNFTPRTNSTFCPVNQHKPLPPTTVDFLFRNLSLAGQTGDGNAHA